MLKSNTFSRKTKAGRIKKEVREIYLRDDIYCGAAACKTCDTSTSRAPLDVASPLLILDTNVLLHQIDLLENSAIDNAVLLSVVLDEVKNKNMAVYNRIRALSTNPLRKFYVFSNQFHKDTFVKRMDGETPNDYNDRAIRVATRWYQTHLGTAATILLITNDRDNKRRAGEEGISADTIQSYVKSLGQPELLDLLVLPASESEDTVMVEVEDLRPSKRQVVYQEHKPMSEITSGLHRGIYHQGKLRVNRYSPFQAYVGSESIGDEIIIYGRENMNRAFDGDIVAVELLPQDQWHEEKNLSIADEEDEEEDDVHLAPSSADDAPRTTNLVSDSATDMNSTPSRPSGRVVGIIKRNWHSYCGSLEPMSMPAGTGSFTSALFVSKDRRIPKIRIQTRQLENLLDKRIIVAVDSWDRQSRYPSGHYVRVIGEIGDRDTESEVVLIENDINSRPFSSQVLACLPPLPWSVSSEDVANSIRQDLRSLRVFSVDPPGCKDIDDALHLTALPNGNYEVGVHIADVTNFVHPGTPLDGEASQRGTSVYLVERRIDMLPKPLTEDICSLRADVERLAFSVIWEMTPDAEIISTRFTKSVIKSCGALSYVEAQARMDDSRLMDPLTTDLRNMNALAKIMRQRRIDRGALTLASAEVKFQIDTETHDPLDIDLPVVGYRDDPYFNKLIRILATRCMTQAVYFCSGDLSPPEYHHYGLAAPLYTHFTSPIRRYADVIVHRLLAASLGIDKLPPVFQDRSQLTSIADNLNYRHRNAQMASRASVELHTLIYFRKRPTDTEARIVKIRSNGFIVFVPKYGIEGPVYLTGRGEKGSGEWHVDEQQQKIVKMDNSNNNSLSYSVLQSVRIHMEVVEPQPNRPKLQLTLIT
ncbi:exosome complex exonuclease RRP44-like protein A [Gossypium australe]|uniref:Exosome complex exonuclease RRP44-like protein A n=1 Tax=Gossypium australe TaxID=47621 RepID=A0A5B6UYL4_9ROSI|nr:exosome complex exonuclease RRP44-like protein A [Gossypium australe]